MVIIMISSSLLCAQEPAASSEKKNTFGVGFGIPYGGLGGNIDFNVAENFYVTGGVGTTFKGVLYNFGVKYFFTPIGDKIRPRISAYYGVNTIEERIGWGGTTWKHHRGVSIGIGVQRMWEKNGLDLDLIIVAYTPLEVGARNRVKVSFGYRRAF